MRLFAAVLPPAPAISHLTAAVRPVRDDRLRWTDTAAWHVTLAFYGQLDDDRVPDLTERLTRAAGRHTTVELRLSGCGRFGSSVLWIGVRGDVEPLRRLATATSAAGRRAGAQGTDRRGFRPHVTVARAPKRDDLRPYVASLGSYDGPAWQAESIALIRSHLHDGPGGRARYETVAEFPLRATSH